MTSENETTYTTQDGKTLELRPISLLEIEKVREGIKLEYKRRGEPIEIPTYTVETVGGGKSVNLLTFDMLETDDPAETLRRKIAWDAYLGANDRMNNELGKIITDIVMGGIVCEYPSDEWIEQKRKRYIQIPETKEEILTLYKRLEVVKSLEDITKIREKIIKLSLPRTPEHSAVKAAEDTFQGSLSQKE